jgi:hypothetical protein
LKSWICQQVRIQNGNHPQRWWCAWLSKKCKSSTETIKQSTYRIFHCAHPVTGCVGDYRSAQFQRLHRFKADERQNFKVYSYMD